MSDAKDIAIVFDKAIDIYQTVKVRLITVTVLLLKTLSKQELAQAFVPIKMNYGKVHDGLRKYATHINL
jgi:hypothetical protein